LSIYVIGDVQGCFDELTDLLNKVKFKPQQDSAWFLGDLINRGPKNLEVINFIRQLPNTQVVLGNHDLHFLAVAVGSQTASPGDTFDDLLSSVDLAGIIDWLRHQPLLYVDPANRCVLVHAGLPPIWDVQTCLDRAQEIQAALTGPDFVDFLAQMYGNEPHVWSDALTGPPRLRLITNYFTRLRYCTAAGELELQHKTEQAPAGFAPWFSFPRSDPSIKILFGHWAALNGETGLDSAVALDTGCVWGRSLTALRLDDGKITAVPARRKHP